MNLNLIDYGWMGSGLFHPTLSLIIIWTLIWKGLALWHSARRREPIWFVAILLLNTVGILEIVYLFFFAKLKKEELFK